MARIQRVVIGWREWLALPALGVPAIKAKIDTGARTSALHAFDVQIYRDRGQKMARFTIHPLQRDDEAVITAEAPLIDHRTVRSSSGEESNRPVICTEIELMGRRWTTEITLVNRDAMGFRMLLGRLALRRGFLVRPGCSYRGGKPARKLIHAMRVGMPLALQDHDASSRRDVTACPSKAMGRAPGHADAARPARGGTR